MAYINGKKVFQVVKVEGGGGTSIETEDISINPTTSEQVVERSSGKYINKVTVGAIQTEEKTVTENSEVTPSPGKYITKVIVNVPSSGGSSGTDRLQWKCDNIKTLDNEFKNYTGESLDEVLNGLDTSQVTSLQYTFNYCRSLKTIPLFDTSSVTTMLYVFANCESLTEIPSLNTSSVTTMAYMFSFCKLLTSIPSLNTSKVTRTASMFHGCSALTSIPLLDTSNVTDMESMFNGCSALTSIPSLNTSKVTSVKNMFSSCTSLTTISLFDMCKVTNNTSGMLGSCKSLQNLTLKNIRISLQLGSGTSWGHLLTDESLINTAKEVWDLTGATSNTLYVSTPSKARFDAIYVKLIDITDEMRAEDQYIDNKKPCVVCESTDEGAMTLREYVVSKNWALA